MHTPYNRRYEGENISKLTIENYAGKAGRLVQYGYVVATADFRGLYGSFGHNEGYNRGEWVGAARYDAYDITEWLADQPWSNGNIGMWGCSATGGSQMQAATTAPPHLKAIFPVSFEFDAYNFRVAGGISGSRAGQAESTGATSQQEKRDAWAAPVDIDEDSSLLKEAIAEHKLNIESAGYIPYRDGYLKNISDEDYKKWWVQSSPSTYLDQINKSGIAMYMAVIWDEGYTKHGPFFAYNNITTPRKLIIGPGAHCDWDTAKDLTQFDILTEELRFFDYWLKGIENGIMEENPVFYYTYNESKGNEWKSAKHWPLREEKRVRYYMGDSSLSPEEPTAITGTDKTRVNYDFKSDSDTTGILIYETAVLENDVQVTGHPEVNLWISSTAADGDFVATMRDVAPDGTISSYNIQGQLRASTRTLTDPPYNNLGLPYHSSLEADVTALIPDQPTRLQFPILPISILFKAGHKIQLVISFSARGTPRSDPPPEVTIYRNKKHKSFITLPVIQ